MSLQDLQNAPPLGEARDRELLKDAHSYVYFESPQGALPSYFFLPPDHNPEAANRTCLVFLHGGLWDMSMPTQFVPHCHHFAARGAVALTVEYRVFNKHRCNPTESIEDVRMAIGFIKQNANLIGIDSDRVVVIGAGSGAHLALCSAVLPSVNVPENGLSLAPAAVIGLSSIVDTSIKGVGAERFPSPKEAKSLSPLTHLPRKNLPPCLLLHGTQDRVATFEQAARFAKAYSKKGNQCRLIDYEGAGHTFFNFNTSEQYYQLTLQAIDHFLVDLGFLGEDELGFD